MTIPWQDHKSTIVEGQETYIKDSSKEKLQSCTEPPRPPIVQEQQSFIITPSDKEKLQIIKTSRRTPLEEGQGSLTYIDTLSEKQIPKTYTNPFRSSAVETQETNIDTLSEEERFQTDTNPQIPPLDINLTRDQSEFPPPNVQYSESVLSNDSEFHFFSTKFKVVCVIFSTLSYHFHLIQSCCFHLFIKGLVENPEIFKDRCSLKDIFSEFGKSEQKNFSLCSLRNSFYIDLHPFPFRSKSNFFKKKKDHTKKQNLFVIFCPPYLKISFEFIYVLEQKHCSEPRQDIRSVGKHRRHLNHSSFLGSGKSALEIHTICCLGDIELK